ncbi:MAG TPA: GNAT family N-acetyltransferase [Symbiobacteriaceae bacterium]|nr:GNAT family N-acetyltransferase [Symbiobacteriaceae bacterium]
MTAWTLRPATRADYNRLAEIYSLVNTTPATAADFVRIDELRSASGPMVRRVAEDAAGRIVAFGSLSVDGWRPAGSFVLQVTVEPGVSGQGLGSRIYGDLVAEAQGYGARQLYAHVRDDRPDWLTWAERRGYRIIDRYFKSELKLSGFDPAPFWPAVERAREAGYRFFTLAEDHTEDGRRRLYELDMDAARDEPGITAGQWPPISFAEYCAEQFATEQFDPRAVAIAEKDGEWAGFSGLHYRKQNNSGWVFFTGVRRAHRGHGLAQALKLLSTEYARAQGWEKIGTSNNALNPAMLAVNRKLGFVPQPGLYVLERDLQPHAD